MRILPATEKQREPDQLGGWQKLARKRHQKGSLRIRGTRDPKWELQYYEDCLEPNGHIKRCLASTILGSTRELTRKQARKAAEEFLRPLNQGKVTPRSQLTLREFVEQYFIPNAFPTLKPSTQRNYRGALTKHLLPAFGEERLIDIDNLTIQSFVLQKMQLGLGWEYGDRLRNLMSKLFATAKRWNFF